MRAPSGGGGGHPGPTVPRASQFISREGRGRAPRERYLKRWWGVHHPGLGVSGTDSGKDALRGGFPGAPLN